jgi:uncharacterized repeat protein (TIGR04138 family)
MVFRLSCRSEPPDETGAIGPLYRFGFTADRLGGQIAPRIRQRQRLKKPNLIMQEVNFDEAVEQILAKDSRFSREAYVFVREALDYTQKLISKESRGTIRHVTGQELLDGIRQFALQQFGPMVVTVFEEWGVKNCRDFGDIVFNMVEISLLAKTEKDTRDDFQNGYDFTEAFRKPFWPQSKVQETKSVQPHIN